jgi:hypothetical protein
MKPTLFSRFTLLLLTLILGFFTPIVHAEKKGKGPRGDGGGAEHPDMHAALDSLRKAKTSAEPVADLNAAYHRLKQGRENKEGYRTRAMNLVEKAMDAERAKQKVEADKLIDEAITVVEKAVTISPDRK